MEKERVHEFNFVMDRGMKESLMDLEMYEKVGSLSGVIVRILGLINPVVKREHKWGEERGSRYMLVCENPDVERENVHVYFPVEVYRELKLMHQDLNFYSIAQLLREFLRFFLDLVGEYGRNFTQELQKLFKEWNEIDIVTQITPGKVIRQLWKIIIHFPGKTGLINIYNRKYSPSWIFRL